MWLRSMIKKNKKLWLTIQLSVKIIRISWFVAITYSLLNNSNREHLLKSLSRLTRNFEVYAIFVINKSCKVVQKVGLKELKQNFQNIIYKIKLFRVWQNSIFLTQFEHGIFFAQIWTLTDFAWISWNHVKLRIKIRDLRNKGYEATFPQNYFILDQNVLPD